MARIFAHALAATAGGGATYLRNFLNHLSETATQHEWLFLVPDRFECALPSNAKVRILRMGGAGNVLRRLLLDQLELRRLVSREKVDLILATGNFGMLRPPVPQVLLNRNPLYFSQEYVNDLRRRGERRELVGTLLRRRLAIASIRDSAVNVTPTAAFGDIIRDWLPPGRHGAFRTVYHGFSHERFVRPGATLAPSIADRLASPPGVRRILMVSHYNYFRNFETLLRGFARLRQTYKSPVELILTTRLGRGVKDHNSDTSRAAALLEELGIEDAVTQLGTTPHGELYPLYRQADVVVCPAYAESFGHPMVEAMASGRPIVAADCPVQREICGEAAAYFSVFDADELAARLQQTLEDAELSRQMSEVGLRRAQDFSWRRHLDELLVIIEETLASQKARVS